jgi:hypothetical protein
MRARGWLQLLSMRLERAAASMWLQQRWKVQAHMGANREHVC